MFENLIGQEAFVSTVTRDITSGTLPASLLFHGPQYSGKLTAALELARAVCCETPAAPWNCGCHSCHLHRFLLHPNTVMMGPRYFSQEIRASAEALKHDRREPLRYLFLRAARKLLRRFDTVLWEGEENKIAKLASSFDKVEEGLDLLAPGKELSRDTKVEQIIDSVVTECNKIARSVPDSNIPVEMVRRISFWARTASAGATKFVILENADRMLESSRNALLKILEEPPPNVYLLLLTTRRTAIIPTILSRVRAYSLVGRDRSTANDVLNRIFREDEPRFDSLRQYFVGSLFTHDLSALARGFLKGVLADEADLSVPRGVAEAVAEGSGGEVMRYFAQELFDLFQRTLRGEDGPGAPGTDALEAWTLLVSEHVTRCEVLNMSLPLVLESLYLKMRAVA